MPRASSQHCNNNCRAPRCQGMSKVSGYARRCCLCTRHPSGLCHHHQRDGPRVAIRPLARILTIGNGLYVARSRIPGAGNGLFTNVGLSSRDWITKYAGPKITRAQAYDGRPMTHLKSDAAAPPIYIDGLRQPQHGRGGASFANDPRTINRQPNAEYLREGNDIYLRVRPGHRIMPGQEIFVSYGTQESFNRTMPR